MTTEWLDNVHDRCDEIRGGAYFLKDIAKSFRNVGNPKVANELDIVAGKALSSTTMISRSIGQMLSDQVNASNKEIGNMLKAILDKEVK